MRIIDIIIILVKAKCLKMVMKIPLQSAILLLSAWIAKNKNWIATGLQNINIARIAIQCHKDRHEFRFSIVRIVINVSKATSLLDYHSNIFKVVKRVIFVIEKIVCKCQKLSTFSKIVKIDKN